MNIDEMKHKANDLKLKLFNLSKQELADLPIPEKFEIGYNTMLQLLAVYISVTKEEHQQFYLETTKQRLQVLLNQYNEEVKKHEIV
jgi:hypothetical protein